ncbi:hypothetical protein GCM10010195_73670 [Kitasatospora griseola]|nr:hypothetical protein GCM10010195_73670 [Kitasatospora griseola]
MSAGPDGGYEQAAALAAAREVAVRQMACESESRSLEGRPELSMTVFVGGEPLAWARRSARDFLARAR